MEHGAMCEPIDVGPELLVRAEHIKLAVHSSAVEPFHHFHDACELIWFRKAQGELISGAGVFEIEDKCAVFIPAMHSHDFRIERGPKEWLILHIDPAIVSTLMSQFSFVSLEELLCCKLEPIQAERIDTLFEWVVDLSDQVSSQRDLLTSIINLILMDLGEATRRPPSRTSNISAKFERLRPALDLVAHDTSGTLSLEEVASACHLSPAYFSRRFKAVFGMNFSEYVRLYRLRLAARRLIGSAERVADIAFSLGFATPAHFSAVFQKRYAMTPRAFRKLARARAASD